MWPSFARKERSRITFAYVLTFKIIKRQTIPSFDIHWLKMYFHFGRNELRCHETTIIYTFGQSFFNKRLSITQFAWELAINQLHYYTIISMKVTVFSAVRQTLQCFHLTLRENNRSLAWFFWKEILSPNFLRKFDYRTRDRLHFLKHTFTLLPLQI